MNRYISTLLVALLCCSPAVADDDWGGDADDIGFSDTEEIAAKAPVTPYSLTGFFRSRQGLWIERMDARPLSTARQSLDARFTYKEDSWRVVAEVHGEYDVAYLIYDDQYDQPTLDTYQWRVLNGEQYLGLSLGKLEVVLGRQVIAWGEGDVFSPLDVVSPRDDREPGLSDLDDLRLATLASQLNLFSDLGRFDLVVTHEGYFGERPSAMGEYSPFRTALASDPLIAELLSSRDVNLVDAGPRYQPASGSVFLRWLWTGEGLDVGFYGAWLRDRQGTVRPPDGFEMLGALSGSDLTAEQLSGVIPAQIDIELEHERYWLVGHSGSKPAGDLLFKWELVFEGDKPVNTGDLTGVVPVIGVERVDVLTGMLGVTYSGLSETTLALEATQAVPFSLPQQVLFPIDAAAFAIRGSRTFMRETLRLDAAVSAIGLKAQYGWLARLDSQYAVTDDIKVGAALIHYGTGQDDEFGPFSGLDSHDQFLAKFRWDFSVL